jgi:hypothetical protein
VLEVPKATTTGSSLCSFVPMLEDTQVHDNEEFSDEKLNFSSSRFFVLVLKVIQMHDDIEFGSSLSFFKNSNAISLKDTMTRSSAPYSCVFLCSSATGPHGHNKELNSSSLCSIVQVLQVFKAKMMRKSI